MTIMENSSIQHHTYIDFRELFFANLVNYTVYTKCNDLPGVHSKHILPYFQAKPYIPVCMAQYQNYMQPIAY